MKRRRERGEIGREVEEGIIKRERDMEKEEQDILREKKRYNYSPFQKQIYKVSAHAHLLHIFRSPPISAGWQNMCCGKTETL